MTTLLRLVAAAWMLTTGVTITIVGALACLFGPLDAALGLPAVLLGLWMAWDAGAIAAGD